MRREPGGNRKNLEREYVRPERPRLEEGRKYGAKAKIWSVRLNSSLYDERAESRARCYETWICEQGEEESATTVPVNVREVRAYRSSGNPAIRWTPSTSCIVVSNANGWQFFTTLPLTLAPYQRRCPRLTILGFSIIYIKA